MGPGCGNVPAEKVRFMAINDKQHNANAAGTETWYVMGSDKVIYGPVPTKTLYQWAAENRIVVGSRVSTDKSSWDPAESLPSLKMEWSAALAGGRTLGPFNILAVPGLFQSGQLPPDATLTNRISGKTLMVYDLVARVPSQNTSDSPTDREGIHRPPVGGNLPVGTAPRDLSSAPPPSPAPLPQPTPKTVVAPSPTPAPEPTKEALVSEPAVPAPEPEPAKAPRRHTTEGTVPKELDRLRKELSDKVLLLEGATRRADSAEDQIRILTERNSEKESGLRKEVELLKKELVATQREALKAEGQVPPEQLNALRDDVLTRDRLLAEAGGREQALRAEKDDIQKRLETANAALTQRLAESSELRSQAETLQAEALRLKEALTHVSQELLASQDALKINQSTSIAALEQERQALHQLQTRVANEETLRERSEAQVAALAGELAIKSALLETTTGELHRAEADLAVKDATLAAQMASLGEEQKGQQDQHNDLLDRLQQRDTEIKHIEQSFQEFRDGATAKARTLTSKLNTAEQLVEKLRADLAESRKQLAEAKAALPTLQAELDRTRNDSTRIILQHQASGKTLQMEKEELALQVAELESSLQAVEQECTQLKATSSAMGQLQKQEVDALRQRLAQLSHVEGAPPSSMPLPAPSLEPTQTRPDIAQLQAEWERERSALELRLEEADQRRADALTKKPTWKSLVMIVVPAVLCMMAGIVIGLSRHPAFTAQTAVGAGVLSELGTTTVPSPVHDTVVVGTDKTQGAAPVEPSAATVKTSIQWPDIKAKGSYLLPTESSCRIILNQGLFSSSTNFAPDATDILTDLAEAVSGKLDNFVLIIHGHTDDTPVSSVANYSDNLRLGLTRADMVRHVLVDQLSVHAAAVQTVSSGEINPPYPNDSDESRLRNRTVTFELKPVTP